MKNIAINQLVIYFLSLLLNKFLIFFHIRQIFGFTSHFLYQLFSNDERRQKKKYFILINAIYSKFNLNDENTFKMIYTENFYGYEMFHLILAIVLIKK